MVWIPTRKGQYPHHLRGKAGNLSAGKIPVSDVGGNPSIFVNNEEFARLDKSFLAVAIIAEMNPILFLGVILRSRPVDYDTGTLVKVTCQRVKFLWLVLDDLPFDLENPGLNTQNILGYGSHCASFC